ncbi:MAG TPA: trypsin-like peptidase domain-containing protein [Candidatus Gallacutalibacter pullistercoris]|nr:trypsin-like peptidase domain-containing protein [Candidatus Gallacutalibacter pullistercoris]
MTDSPWKGPNQPEPSPENTPDSYAFNFPDVSFDNAASSPQQSDAEQQPAASNMPEPESAGSQNGPAANSNTENPAQSSAWYPDGPVPHSQQASATPPQNPYQDRQSSSYYDASSANTQGSFQGPSPFPYDYQQPPTYSPMGGWNSPPSPPQRPSPGKQQKIFLVLIAGLLIVLAVGFGGYSVYSSLFGDPAISSTSSSTEDFLPSVTPEPTEIPDSSQQESSKQEVPSVGEGGNIEINPYPSGDSIVATEIYKKVSPSVVGIIAEITDADGNTTSDQGSGIVATEDGYIITNSHVINDSRGTSVKVVTRDETEYPGVVVGYDRTTDLAIVKIDAAGLTPAEFGNSDEMEVGETVYAIGNPGGLKYASSMTQGIISALNRVLGSNSQNGMTYLQTDAAINPGNSGGALVNEYGQVIGINSSKLVAEDFEGMGFAIPVSQAQDIINSLMNYGYVEGRTRLGIAGRDISEQESQFYDVPVGFLILEIDDDSTIGTAGGAVNDIICAVNGHEVTCLADISGELLGYHPGDSITLTLYRMPAAGQTEGSSFDITITLLEDRGETQSTN